MNDSASEYDSADALMNNLGEIISRSKSIYQAELETLGKTVYTTISSFKKPLLTNSSDFEASKKLLYFRVENQIETSRQNFCEEIDFQGRNLLTEEKIAEKTANFL